MEQESDGDTRCNRRARYIHQRIGTRTRGLVTKRTSQDHPNYSIVEISQNIEKNPGDLRRLAVTQTPVENHQLTLVWKTLKRVNDDNNNGKKNNYTNILSDKQRKILMRRPGHDYREETLNENMNLF